MSMLFSIVAAPVYIPTNHVGGSRELSYMILIGIGLKSLLIPFPDMWAFKFKHSLWAG